MAPECVRVSLLGAALCLVALPTVAGFGYMFSCPAEKHLTAELGINKTLKSPRYPFNYPNNKNCTWQVRAEEGQVVVLYVLDFDLENSDACQYDALLLYDGGQPENGSLLARLCGSHCEPQYSSTGRQMYIQFLTDSDIRRKGFKLMFTAAQSSRTATRTTTARPTTRTTTSGHGSGEACPQRGYLTVEQGRNKTLTSPNYPGNYSPSQSCAWRLAGWRRRIQLYVVDLDMEDTGHCISDSLTIYDGGYPNVGNRLAILCGTRLPPVYISSGSEMFISFSSDYSVQGKGFKLLYTTLDSTTITTTPIFTTASQSGPSCPFSWSHGFLVAGIGFNTSLVSPKYPLFYPPNLDCEWNIRAANPSSKIRLYVLDLDIERDFNCSYDSLTFLDENGWLLGKYCNRITTTLQLTFGSQVTVRFHSDSSESGMGFKLLYTAVPASIGSFTTTTQWNPNFFGVDFLTADLWDKTLTSLNYPQQNTKQFKGWAIKTQQSEGFNVRVFIVDLQLERRMNGSCAGYLSIYDSGYPRNGPLLSQLCGGSHNNRSFYSSGAHIFLLFYMDESVLSRGFKVLFSAVRHPYGHSIPQIPPSHTIRLPAEHYYKDLKSLDYVVNNYSRQKWQWIIWCQPGQAVQLDVQTMDLQDSPDCNINSVIVTDSDDMAVLARMCNSQYRGVSLYSVRGTVLHVRYSMGQAQGKARVFHLRYRAVPSSLARVGYTTQSPLTHHRDDDNVSYAVVIAGVLGGCIVLGIALCVLYRACSRSKQYQRPHVGRLPSVTFRSRPSANANNTVYIVPPTSNRAPLDGFTNLAYSEGPPSYSSLQHMAPQAMPAGAVAAAAHPHDVAGLPTYCEAIRLVPPPDEKGVNGGLPAPPVIESPTPQPTAAEASPTSAASASQPEEATPASSHGANASNI